MRLSFLLIILIFFQSCTNNPTDTTKGISVNFIPLLEGYSEFPKFFHHDHSNLLFISGRKEFTDDYSLTVLDDLSFEQLAFFENASVLASGNSIRLNRMVASDNHILLFIDRVLHRLNPTTLETTPLNNLTEGYPHVLKETIGVGIEYRKETSTYEYVVMDLQTGDKIAQNQSFKSNPDIDYAFQISGTNYVYFHSTPYAITRLELNEETGQLDNKSTIGFSSFETFENFALSADKTELYSLHGNIYTLSDVAEEEFKLTHQFDAIDNEENRFTSMYLLASPEVNELLYFGFVDSLYVNLPLVTLIQTNNTKAYKQVLPFANTDYPKLNNYNTLPVLAYISREHLNIVMEYKQEGKLNYFIEQYMYEDFYRYLINTK